MYKEQKPLKNGYDGNVTEWHEWVLRWSLPGRDYYVCNYRGEEMIIYSID